MNGLQLINLLTGQQPGQANGAALSGIGALFAGGPADGSADGSGRSLFQTTLSGLLTGTSNAAGAAVAGASQGSSNGQGLGIGLFSPAGDANALLVTDQNAGAEGGLVATKGATEGQAGVIGAQAAQSSASEGVPDAASAEELAELQIIEDIESALVKSEANSNVNPVGLDFSQSAAGAGAESLNPFLSGTPTSTPAATKSSVGINAQPGGPGKAVKAAALLHASPSAVEAILTSAATSKNPVFAADAGAAGQAGTGGDTTPTASETTMAASVAGPVASADLSNRQAATLKGNSAENGAGNGAGQDHSSGKEGGAGAGSDFGAGTGAGTGSGFGAGGQSLDGESTAAGNGWKAGAGTSAAPNQANSEHANPATQGAAALKMAATAIAPAAVDRAPQAGLFAALESGVSEDPFFGFQTASSTAGSTTGLGVTQPGAVNLASATGPNQPGAAPSFVPTPHAASAQVGLQVTRAVVNGDSEFTVRLNPKELGKVEARIEFTAGRGVRAHFVAESREALAILQKDSHVLERALTDAGLDTGSATLNFSLKQNGEGQADGSLGSEGDFGSNELAGEELPEIDVTDQIIRQVITDSAVDITI